MSKPPFEKVYVNAAYRSPIGKFGGALKNLNAPTLAGKTLNKAIQSTEKKTTPDCVLMGHARQAGCGPNPARQATVLAGLSHEVPAWTLNQACASGLSAVAQSFDRIRMKLADQIWAGGVESMSNTPYLLMDGRWGKKMGSGKILDGMHQDGFFCPMADMLMGSTVEEHIVKERKISRSEQDEFALSSQLKAASAQEKNFFSKELLPIEAEGKKFPGLNFDEHVRPQSKIEGLAKLSPVFDPENGSITAGNASGITDGAAWLQLSNIKNSSSLVEIIDYEMTALDPKYMGLGPITATQKLLQKNSLQVKDIALFEINEAFAAQALACQKDLQIPNDKLNIRGGAIALGHPIGATGARILVTLTHALTETCDKGSYGIATLCVSGGMGFSMLIRSCKE